MTEAAAEWTEAPVEDLRGPEQTETGVAIVDDALARLSDLAQRPVDEHPAVFEAVHGALRQVLGGDRA